MDASATVDLLEVIARVRHGASGLGVSAYQQRDQAIAQLAQRVKSEQNAILEANTLDLETSRELAISGLLLTWLKLTPERIHNTIQILEHLAVLPTPTLTRLSTYQGMASSHQGWQVTPLGVIGLLYEAFPELALILGGMCLKTANGLLLRGGSEATHTNQILAELMADTLEQAQLPPTSIQALPCDRSVPLKDLVVQSQIDAIVPYGRPSFTQPLIRQATLPIFNPVMGNCYLFWSASSSNELVRTILVGSHQGLPDAVNAVEKVLVDINVKRPLLNLLWSDLTERGFELQGDAEMAAEFPDHLTLANPEDWQQPYLRKVVAFKWVAHLTEAIDWINTHSSGHADCIATESYRESRQFTLAISSATVHINACPRFSRQSSGPHSTVALGMCGRGGFRPGPIGLGSLLTTKQILHGEPSPS
ncbi:gamma-glutamyl-phosphate reductase [Synechococcales cyanobacterium C]|uniref:Gamma-glutamyl phosphate reductase n=1 Tax=Petrachloros mirabilis ULC683 TaxID=2781853 RepID=A0A8K1ZVV4_9CYAN|nr:gamma-glutamyl-phosphate reductase [Petrachloros mirabilis]NCJ05083.1 gamma-glutamyl-phosphate reductase [Petrachloros mirabilis ULC683]